MAMKNKYQEALDLLKCNSEQHIANHYIGLKMKQRFEESDKASKLLQELVNKHENIKNTLNKVISERLNKSKKVLERDEISYIQALQFVLKLLEVSDNETTK